MPPRRPLPPEFAALVAAGVTPYELRKRYRCSDSLIQRWIAEVRAAGTNLQGPPSDSPPDPPPTERPAPVRAKVTTLSAPPPTEPRPALTPCDPAEAARAVRDAAAATWGTIVATLEAVATADDTSAGSKVAACRELRELIGDPPPLPPTSIPIPANKLAYAEAMYQLVASRMSRASADAPFAALARRLDACYAAVTAARDEQGDDFAGKSEPEILAMLHEEAENMEIERLKVYYLVYCDKKGIAP